MKKGLFFYVLLAASFCMLSSCNDVDVDNIDPQAELDLGLALPIGDLRATIGDFLGNGQVSSIYVGPGDVLYFEDTFHITRKFHDVDLKSKITNVTEQFNVYKELDRQGKLDADGNLTGDGKQIKLEFPFTLKLKNVNSDINDERLDSVMVENAMFTSKIGRTNLPLPEEWVDKVEIVLGNEFTRNAGKSVTVCTNDFAYDKRVPITVDQFMLTLMKNKNPQYYYEYPTNVVDTCHLQINFYFTVPVGQKKQISSTARYDYNLEVEFIDFAAAWGYFKPSSQMRDKGTIVIADEWDGWRDIQKARLPFSEPVVNMYVHSKIAGKMVMHGEYLYAKSDQLNDSIYATFDEAMTQVSHVETFVDQPYLTLKSKIGDSITMREVFNKDWDKGHIERLFTIRPDILGYKFFIDFDTKETPQTRVLPNSNIRVDAIIHAPFKFNKGLEASYMDTIQDVDLSSLSIDSLVSGLGIVDSVKASDLKMVIAIRNLIPLRMKGWFRFIDENGKIIMDPTLKEEPLRIGDADTLRIASPQVTKAQGVTIIDKDHPGETVYTMALDREHFDLLKRIKSIRFYTELDAQPLDPHVNEDFRIRITTEDAMTVHIGISAYIDAVMNFGKKDNDNK